MDFTSFWRLLRQRIRQAFRILTNEGLSALLFRLRIQLLRRLGMNTKGRFDHGYEKWRLRTVSSSDNQRLDTYPLFSIIVPIYNVERKWLDCLLTSIETQSYPHWQLCLVDDCSSEPHIRPWLRAISQQDPRIKVAFNSTNSGIASTSNHALSLGDGDYIALLDHDDELSPNALMENARLINARPELELIYSDEDKISLGGKHRSPFFKPDFSPDLLCSQNYMGHLIVAKRALIDRVGGFSQGIDGSQDYDLLLRLCEQTNHIAHLPKVLYHWREIPGSTASAFAAKSYAWEAGREALVRHCARQNKEACVELGPYPGSYRIKYAIKHDPKISIIIPFKDQGPLLEKCIDSLFRYTQWQNIEVIAINNLSEYDATIQTIDRLKNSPFPITFVDYPYPFNFSAVCNFGLTQASGEFVVLMNNDIEILDDGWLEALLEHAQRPDIGAVGGKLLYPNGEIQHAGIVLGIDGGAGHPFKGLPDHHTGYFLRHHLVHNVSALTGALVMIKKSRLLQAGGLDEDFAIAYNDVDLCLSLSQNGYRHIWTPYCRAIHHESISRGQDVDPIKKARHDAEKQRLRSKWPTIFTQGDPFYNPNLTLTREDYSLG